MPSHKVVSGDESQGMTEVLGTERFGDATFTSGMSRRAFLQTGAVAVAATGLASAGADLKGDETMKASSKPGETGRKEEAMTPGGLSRARLGRMHDVLAGHVESGRVPGLVTLISRRGEVHVDAIGMKKAGGSDPMRRDTIFRIASMTKPVTAAAAMILVEECKLRLDEPVDRLE
jgi:CubicO group peptidase (beta-lactamase class C family)